VYFGDDRHGRSVPEGARNVRAVRYRLASGSASAVPAEQIATLVSALPGVTGATNPLPASGGAASETRDAAIRRAPEEIRAQGRAVTAADYALLALGSPGALVARAHAVAAFDARFPGASTPGVVTVFVVTPVRAGQLPIADDEALRSVAAHLSGAVAPLGVEVVAAVPLFQRVGVMAELELDPDADPVESLHAASDRLDAYLHPLTGGDDGRGWPFGGPVRYGALVRAVMDGTSGGHRAVRGVAVLRYSVDGRPVQRCTDHAIAANSLVWPGTHRLSALRSS
jgi:predicted phage baseplate assembly protein